MRSAGTPALQTTWAGSGPARFGVLLPETGEVEAINYVERVREACDLWLESGAVALHLSMGWASPGPESSLADAVARAQERMFAEQRRNERLARDIEVDGLAAGPRHRGIALARLTSSDLGQSRPLRRPRPGVAPVCTPSATTSVPATMTCSMPIG